LTVDSTAEADASAAALAAVEAKTTRALSLVPDYARAHVILDVVLISSRRVADGPAAFEHALALDPNLANAHAPLGDLC
jgi:hypothetical protein